MASRRVRLDGGGGKRVWVYDGRVVEILRRGALRVGLLAV